MRICAIAGCVTATMARASCVSRTSPGYVAAGQCLDGDVALKVEVSRQVDGASIPAAHEAPVQEER